MRLPRVGERWVIRPRPGEWACPACGHIVTCPEMAGLVVTVVPMGNASLIECGMCGFCRSIEGLIRTNLRDKKTGHSIAVPYTWLEPLPEEALPMRIVP